MAIKKKKAVLKKETNEFLEYIESIDFSGVEQPFAVNNFSRIGNIDKFIESHCTIIRSSSAKYIKKLHYNRIIELLVAIGDDSQIGRIKPKDPPKMMSPIFKSNTLEPRTSISTENKKEIVKKEEKPIPKKEPEKKAKPQPEIEEKPQPKPVIKEEPCPMCNGEKQLHDNGKYEVCKHCRGTGTRKGWEAVNTEKRAKIKKEPRERSMSKPKATPKKEEETKPEKKKTIQELKAEKKAKNEAARQQKAKEKFAEEFGKDKKKKAPEKKEEKKPPATDGQISMFN